LLTENRQASFERANPDASTTGGSAYFIDFSDKLSGIDPSDFEGWLRATDPTPTRIAQVALASFDHASRSPDGEAARRLGLAAASALVERSYSDGETTLWGIAVPVAKYGLAPGWNSALTQSFAASALLRAAEYEPNCGFREVAYAAGRALLPGMGGGLVIDTVSGPALEEAPSEVPSLILNGWVYGLFGLWELGCATGDRRFLEAFSVSVDALVAMLPRYHERRWSRYSLYPHAMPDLAKPFYHALHIEQMRVLAALTGVQVFAQAADTWSASMADPLVRVGVISQKLVFAARVGTLWRP
jgi:hypothetical protein